MVITCPRIILLVNTSSGAWCKSEPLRFSRVRRRTNFLPYNKLENSNFQKCPGKALITSFMIIFKCVLQSLRPVRERTSFVHYESFETWIFQ